MRVIVGETAKIKKFRKKEKTKNRKIIEKKPKKSEDSQQLSLFDMEDFDE